MTQTTERLDVGRLQMFLNAHG
ncbi:MAG: hypothetical protein QOH21_1865, partial [Acidobacteriota bacterium]|nr:hypothetical protein [Acidobacteriota bacterium]